MKRIYTLASLVMLAIFSLKAQVQITNTNIYKTAGQMLLANEINESGEPFAEALGYNLDNLNPFTLNSPDSIAYTTGIESYEYSRYALATIVSQSGMGLHMMWSPVISQKAAMEPSNFDGTFTGGMQNGFKEDDELMKTIAHFILLTNHMAPANAWPQFAEFESGDPHLPQPVDTQNFSTDFSTLRWDRSKMNKTLNLAAMGQTLMKQYLWAQDMLGAFHDSLDNGIDPDGVVSPDSAGSPHFDPGNNVYYGGDGLDGFIGHVLTAEAINKTLFVINRLAYNGDSLGAVNPMTYDPANGIQYFPHRIDVTETQVNAMLPPKLSSLIVSDAASLLWDQLSYLWGTLNFTNMMNPNDSSDAAHLAYKAVFDGDPFPAAMSQTGMPGPYDLMKGTAKVIFQNLMAMHYNMQEGTFVDSSGLDGSKNPVPGNTISTQNAGYILVILKQVVEEFAGTPIEGIALGVLNAQAAFLSTKLKDPAGGYYNRYTIGNGPDSGAKKVVSQAAAARGLYAAYEATGNSAYLATADNAYNYLISEFYVPSVHSFRTEQGNPQAIYSPEIIAIIAGALREGSLTGNNTVAPAIYTLFFKKVVNSMQLSEGPNTGENGSDSDGDGIPFIPEQANQLPPVFATEATLSFPTGILEQPMKDITKIYPNPVSAQLNLYFLVKESGRYAIRILNYSGAETGITQNLILQKGIQTAAIPVANLASGFYLIEITGVNNHNTYQKFIKQ